MAGKETLEKADVPPGKDPDMPMARQFGRFFPLLLICLGILAYANSFRGVFILDDYQFAVSNENAGRSFAEVLRNPVRPRILVDITFALNKLTGGTNPADYHATNLLIHLIAACMLYGVLRLTMLLPAMPAAVRERADVLAFFAAGLWVAHPLTTSSVTYICQRYECMMAVFYLLTLYAVIRGSGSARPAAWYVLAIISCAAGMASKEIMVTAPLAVLTYDRMFLADSLREVFRKRRYLHTGLWATILIIVVLMVVARNVDDPYSWHGFSRFAYATTQAGVVVHYLRLAFWPDGLCLDYSWPMAEGIGSVMWQGVLLTGITLATVWGVVRRKPMAYCWFCFFLILAPTSSIIPRPDAAFEHRMYLPLAAVCVAVAVSGFLLMQKLLKGWQMAALGATVMVSLASLTYLRNADYRSGEAMWRDVVSKRPYNMRARIDLAVALTEAGKINEALSEYGKVLGMIPLKLLEELNAGRVKVSGSLRTDSWEFHYFRVHVNQGLLFTMKLGDDKKALEHYVLALRVLPNHRDTLAKTRHVLVKMGVQDSEVGDEIGRLISGQSPAKKDERIQQQ